MPHDFLVHADTKIIMNTEGQEHLDPISPDELRMACEGPPKESFEAICNKGTMRPARQFECAFVALRRAHEEARERTGNEVVSNLDGVGAGMEVQVLMADKEHALGTVTDFFNFIGNHEEIARRESGYTSSKILSEEEVDRVVELRPKFTNDTLPAKELEELAGYYERWCIATNCKYN